MKLIIVIAILFFPPLWIRAQQHMYPFEDYRTCMTGFKSQKGDTIWPAVFEKVKISQGWDEAFWIVTQDEKTGLLDQKGHFLYPCMYENIRYYPEIGVLLMDSTNRSCIRSQRGELLLPYKYNSIQPIIYDKKTFYEVESDDKKGLLDANFNPLIPVVYSNISISKEYGTLHAKTNYILVELASKKGAFRWDGTEIFPPRYTLFQSIEVPSAYSDRKIIHSYFTFTENIGTSWIYGLLDANGKEVYRSTKYDYYKVFPISTNTVGEEQIIVTARNNLLNKVVAFTLENPAIQTPEMESLEPTHNGVLGKLGDSVYFFNLQMNGVRQFKGSTYYLTNEISPYYNADSRENYEGSLSESIFKDVFLIYAINKSEHQNKNEYHLYSTIHHKSSKKTYTEIERYTLFGNDFFWCYRVNSRNKQQLDILNDSLEVVAHFNKAFFLVADPIISHSSREVLLHVNDYFDRCGIISTDGRIIIPVHYEWIQKKDDEIFEAYQPHNQLIDYYFQDGRLIAKDVLNFQEINTEVYAIQHKNHLYSLYSKSLELLMDSCTEVIRSDYYLPLEHSSISANWVVLKKDHFFGLRGEDIYSIDLDNHGNEPVVKVFGKFLISSDNEILHRGDITEYDDLFLVDGTDSVHWVKRDGKVLRSLKKTSIQVTDKYVFLNDKENSAVLRTKTAEWVVNPQPLHVIVLDKNNQAGIWGKLNQQESWVLLDSTGRRLLEQHFDFPVPLKRGTSTLFQNDGRFGLLNQQMQLVLPAVYEAIFDLDGAYCFRKDVKWGLLSSNGNQINALFDAVTPIDKSDKIIVFLENRVGLLDKTLKWVLPLMSYDSIIKHTDIARLINQKLDFPKDFSDSSLFREIMNRELLIQISGRNIGNRKPYFRVDIGAFYFSDKSVFPAVNGENYGNYSNTYNFHFKCNRILLNEKYYSVCLENENQFADYKPLKDLKFPEEANSGKFNHWSYYNFTIEQDSLMPMILADLFKEGTNEQLNVIIEKEIVQQQIFGVNCVNLPEKINLLQRNFYLSPFNLVLFGTGDKQLFISYEKLKEILRYPELFL